jgi:restriction system protein
MQQDVLHFQSSGRYPTSVVGESHYQDHLAYLAEIYPDRLIETVDLYLEENSPYDANQVNVSVEGETVGHLSRADAIRYRQRLKQLGHPSAIGVCAGKLIGGRRLDDGNQASYGIVLNLDIDHLEIAKISQVNASAPPLRTQPAVASRPQPKATPSYVTVTSDKKKWVAFVLCFLLGIMGAHYFYVGRFGRGLLYLFTGGLFAIGWIVDLFVILGGGFKDAGGLPLQR